MSERQTLPVVPLRSSVVFPGLTVPIAVGRDKTRLAIEAAAQRGDRVFAVAQRENVDAPEASHLYTMGVIARISQVQRSNKIS